MKRVILLILDSAGIGEMPDSHIYNDFNVNTIGNIASKINAFKLSNLEQLGLGNIDDFTYPTKVSKPIGAYGRMEEESIGKDTIIGHWEIAGIKIKKPFPLYPDGFPSDLIQEFERRIGTKIIGNLASSGTEIINKLGDYHVKTGYPIVYTSGDSVFQIAAHEDIIDIDKLYKLCEIARDMLKNEHSVGRVIARPFKGISGNYIRTDNRKDFSLKPIAKSMLEYIKEKGYCVKAVGKIEDIFGGVGITHAVHTNGNDDGIRKTLEYMKEEFTGLLFTNLVDFDMLYGHRNDVEGYANALISFDQKLPYIIKNLNLDDLLIITADHGCDPTTKGTDHTREYVPLLVYKKNMVGNINLGTRKTFADVAKTILDYLNIKNDIEATSFLKDLI
jgi:phosphopentomutase